ncbi:MAG: hypothetical protein LAO09_21720 [Acidobacteriia bacterium]|nr:hypothetical protein [Terriglobia bacterium]
MLPVFVALFLISYGLMAVLVVEQGRTIDNQRSLIRSLFSDSTQLSQLKGKASQKQRAEAQAQADARAHSQVQTPSAQDKPQDPGKKNSGKLRKPVPQRPPTDATSLEDERRIVVRI